MTITRPQQVILSIFAASSVWWLSIFLRGIQNTAENYLFNVPMALVPIISGVYAIYHVYIHRSEYASTALRAVYFCSIALIAWGLGNVVYLYYNLGLGDKSPFLSFSDAFYLPSSILRIIGLLYLAIFFSIAKILKNFFRHFFIYLSLSLFCFFLLALLLNVEILNSMFSIEVIYVLYIVLDLIIFIEVILLAYGVWVNYVLFGHHVVYLFFFGIIFNYIADIVYMIQANNFFVASWIDYFFFIGITLQALAVLSLLIVTARDIKFKDASSTK